LDNFEWPYLRNGSRSTYIARDDSAHRAVIFATAQLSCCKTRLKREIMIAATWGICSSAWRMQRIELNREEEPVWLTPYLRDPQPEGERDSD